MIFLTTASEKFMVAISFVAISFSCSYTQPKGDSNVPKSLSKKAKTITITTQNYSQTTGNPEGAPFKSSVVSFDMKGNKVEDVVFYPNGQSQIETHYDSLGKVSEEIHFDEHKKITRNCHYSYQSNIVKKRSVSGDGELLDSSVQKLNDAGIVVEETFYKNDGSVEVVDQYQYDKDGKLVSKKRGNVANWKYLYDGNGNLVEINGGYYSADECDNSQMKYDEHDLLKEKTDFFQPGERKSVSTYTYEFY